MCKGSMWEQGDLPEKARKLGFMADFKIWKGYIGKTQEI